MAKRLVRTSVNEAKLGDIKQINPEFIEKTIQYAKDNFNFPNPPPPDFGGRHMGLMQQIQRKQAGHQEELTKIALDLIDEYYGEILQDVDVDAKIVTPGDPDQIDLVNRTARNEEEAQEEVRDFHEKEKAKKEEEGEEIDYGSEFDIESALQPDEDEVAKRKILNAIQQGEAQNVHSMIRGAQDRIDAIAPGLTDDYLNFLQLNRTLDWFDGMNLGMAKDMPQFANANAVSWGDEEEGEDGEQGGGEAEYDEKTGGNPKITAVGLDLPILIHEVVKGIYELISANAIDEDALRAQGVMAKTDTLEDEKRRHQIWTIPCC